ncbi:Barstar (barnase inhibitor) [Mariniphaga sediminis]|uniref:Barstar (Barnase inhibitor) n=1 Tax=Mariniphaga sediminis TaxID=1628158 RepID=A0A399D0Y9_9BACT|nr:barstar family protein [Mariniphaga sediminis]RIH65096.1 Barstar (barnase inhibitor) [Mariniphaga sediminis]
MEQKIAIIDGDNFSDLETFYDEVDRVLTKDINVKTGHNLDAFNDILCGDFGVFSYNETLKLIWTNFTKSRKNLGDELISVLTGIIRKHDHIEFQIID